MRNPVGESELAIIGTAKYRIIAIGLDIERSFDKMKFLV